MLGFFLRYRCIKKKTTPHIVWAAKYIDKKEKKSKTNPYNWINDNI